MIGGFIGAPIGGASFEATAAVGSASGLGTAAATGARIAVANASTAAGLGTANGAGGKLVTVAGSASGLGQANGVGASFILSYLRPDGDVAADNWTDQAGGGTNIYQAIDEASASDADYVQSPVRESAVTDLAVRLLQGSTLIAEWSHANVGETFSDAVQTLTAPQVAAITNFANLNVEFDDGVDVYRFSLGDPAGEVAPPITVKYRYKKLAA